MKRPNAIFCYGKYCVLDYFCFAEFLAYCTLENKSSKTCEYQPDGLDDNLIENNHEECSYPKKNQIDISGKIMRCRKVRKIHRYHVPNKLLSAKKCAHYVLLLFYPFRAGKELLLDFPTLYQNKLQEQSVQNVVNTNKIKFEPYGGLVDQAYSKFNEISINNQDPQSQIENNETPGAKYSHDIYSDDRETKLHQFSTLCQKYYQIMISQNV